MSGILLTKDTTFIIGPVAEILGLIMNAIFNFLNLIGIPNVGLAIILFTIVIYLLLMPLTIKQQKFSKLSAKMNPEIQAIQAKYKNKKDNNSMVAMNEETKEVYAKYGVSPTGSCLQLLIQMPILFALYRVIYNMPAYVTTMKNAFFPLVDNLISQNGSVDFIKTFKNANMFTKHFENELFVSGNTEYIQNTFIDVLNKASTTEWNSIGDKFSVLSSDVTNTLTKLNEYNNFLGMNMADSPSFMMKEAFTNGSFLMVVAAFIVPLLAALTQWLNVKLMPQADANANPDNPMASSMKTMNTVMPLMSAFFCFTLPTGLGLYWVAGAVVRSIQQIAINKHIDKMDINELIKKNIEKNNKKPKKVSVLSQSLASNAKISTKTSGSEKSLSQEEKDAALKKASEYYNSNNVDSNSIAAKANMVRKFNEKNNK
ncbi:MAG: YidC/Oxa1 family membrane protein insertase [Lachnospiraceae bacterium]|nr:YidC/Oxa1 family membrane protein insertase [Lachnospiraceae bacterium]